MQYALVCNCIIINKDKEVSAVCNADKEQGAGAAASAHGCIQLTCTNPRGHHKVWVAPLCALCTLRQATPLLARNGWAFVAVDEQGAVVAHARGVPVVVHEHHALGE